MPLLTGYILAQISLSAESGIDVPLLNDHISSCFIHTLKPPPADTATRNPCVPLLKEAAAGRRAAVALLSGRVGQGSGNINRPHMGGHILHNSRLFFLALCATGYDFRDRKCAGSGMGKEKAAIWDIPADLASVRTAAAADDAQRRLPTIRPQAQTAGGLFLTPAQGPLRAPQLPQALNPRMVLLLLLLLQLMSHPPLACTTLALAAPAGKA